MIRVHMCTPDGEIKGIVQIIHGIAEHMDRYDSFMSFLAENGYIAVGDDHLGHGQSIVCEEDKGFFAEENGWWYAVRDEEKLRAIMQKKYPTLPIIGFGHSMGSFLLRTHIILYPMGFTIAVISGTGNQSKALVKAGLTMGNLVVDLKGPHHYSKLLNNMAFGSYNKIYSEVKTEFDWLSRDETVVKKYIDDPLCGFIASCSLFRDMMDGIDYITEKENLGKMDKSKPVYFMSGAMDPVGECGKGVQLAYDSFKEAGMSDVSIKLYPDGRHEMLNELNSTEVYIDILTWIESKL